MESRGFGGGSTFSLECVSIEHGWLHGHVTWAVTQGLAIGKVPGSAKRSSCNSYLFFFFFKPEALHHSFSLGPTNFVAEL